MTNLRRGAAFCIGIGLSLFMTACGGNGGGGTAPPPPPSTYVLTVQSSVPASGVAITVSPADNNNTTSGTTAFTLTYNSGTSVTLTAPATSGADTFSSWTGCTTTATVKCTVTVNGNMTVSAAYTAPVIITPTVTVTPTASSITTTQSLGVTVAVSGGSGNPTPTGSVTLTSGTYTSAAATLVSGSAQITIPAGSLAVGSDTLTASYTPDLASSSTYNKATGTSSAVSVAALSTVTVNPSSPGLAVTDQILGMNMAMWYDPTTPAIQTAFASAGIKAVRWPGGSNSDLYNWETNTECGGYSTSNSAFSTYVSGFITPYNGLISPAKVDLALTADYGTGTNCTGYGDPTEAANWVTDALSLGVTVSHMTVGNEEYGHWEEDNHTVEHDPTTYAAAVGNSTSNGYYEQIKTASPNTLVGVDVDAGEPAVDDVTADWDPIVLANAQYDFVEFHYYPQNPGGESDTYLVQSAAQGLTTGIDTIKAELSAAGKPNTPIYVGEMGSVSSNPGKQSWSITQGLYAGQVLGEMMNDGVSRATWWIGFGNCNGTGSPSGSANLSASIYGWQDFGAYNVFSDGPSDTTCPDAGPLGTMSPTAQAFSLFQNVAVNGENVLTPTVTGDTTDVRAYAATHSGGQALVLFNVNETNSQPVTITLTGKTTSAGVTVITYDKAIYDLSGSPTGTPPDPAGTSTWAPPTTTSLGAQSLPLSLTLAPWSMNVVIIE